MAGIPLALGFDVGSAIPLDTRSVAPDIAARDAIPSGVRYEGMIVYVEEEQVTYQLAGGTTNDFWVEFGGGSGSFNTPTLMFGDGTTATDKYIEVDNGGFSRPALKYNNATMAWEYSNDGINYQPIGSGGGVGSVDVLYSETFDDKTVMDFPDRIGFALDDSAPIHGKFSGFFYHDSIDEYYVAKIIEVPEKFRDKAIVFEVDVQTGASEGKVHLTLNTLDPIILIDVPLSGPVNGSRKNAFTTTIPAGVTHLEYIITAFPESGGRITRIDDIVIRLQHPDEALIKEKVSGPTGSVTDNTIPRYDGTSGYQVQGSGVVINDSNAISGLTGLSTSGTATFSGAVVNSSNTTNSQSGERVVITNATTAVTRLTNANLVSISGYANATSGRRNILINATGNDILVYGEDTSVATANNRFSTGYEGPIIFKNGAALELVFNTTTQRHHVIGGTSGTAWVPTSQSLFISSEADLAGEATITTPPTSTTGSGLFSYNTSTGLYTVLKRSEIHLNMTTVAAASNTVQSVIYVNGGYVGVGANDAAVTQSCGNASYSQILNAGDSFYFKAGGGLSTGHRVSVLATGLENALVEENKAVVFKSFKSGNQSLTTNSNNAFTGFTPAKDTHSGWNSVSHRYVFPESGDYDINLNIHLLVSSGSPSLAPAYRLNGGGWKYIGVEIPGAGRNGVSSILAGINKDDYIEFGCWLGGTTVSSLQASGDTHIAIAKRHTSAVNVASLETVAVRAVKSDGQAIPNNSATTLVWDAAETFDTHGAFNPVTGIFTCPRPGYYRVRAFILFAGANFTSGTEVSLELIKNTTFSHALLGYEYSTATVNKLNPVGGSDTVYLNQGETVQIKAYQNSGATRVLHTASRNNYLSIVKVG